MTPSQLRRCNVISSMIERYYGGTTYQAPVTFTLTVLSHGAVMLNANNITEARWFDTFYHCNIVIGKQGGIDFYQGNMRPKLVLPATPRRCNYEDPFKKLRGK